MPVVTPEYLKPETTSIFIPGGVQTHGLDIGWEKVVNQMLLHYFDWASDEIRAYTQDQVQSIIATMIGKDASYLSDFSLTWSVRQAFFTTLNDFEIVFEKEEWKLTHKVHRD